MKVEKQQQQRIDTHTQTHTIHVYECEQVREGKNERENDWASENDTKRQWDRRKWEGKDGFTHTTQSTQKI